MIPQNQIKIIDFRNATYQGYLTQTTFDKLGAILTQDFLFCLSNWNKGTMNGPCFTLFPNQRILYADFIRNYPQGLCCYEMGRQCQLYAVYRDGIMQKNMVAVFPNLSCVVDIGVNKVEIIQRMEQYEYGSAAEKWAIIEKLLGVKVMDKMKRFHKFVKMEFIDKCPDIQEAFGEEYYLGFKGEGLGFKIDPEEQAIKSVGYYDKNKMLKGLGKRIINRDKKVREQGIYQKPETLVRYQNQQRPQKNKKYYRDYFRLSMSFQNKFLQLPNLQKIYKQFNTLKIKIRDSTTQRIAQQLIQHLDQGQIVQYQNPSNPSTTNRLRTQSNARDRSQIYRQMVNKMMPDVSLDRLKQQLNRSMSHKKSRDKSPYDKYDTKPAQLKYTSKKYDSGGSNRQLLSQNRNYDRNQYKYSTPTQQQQRKYPYKQITRQLDYQRLLPSDINNPIQQPYKHRYPIQQNLKPIKKYTPAPSAASNNSRTPTKVQRVVPQFKYLQSDQNPQRQYQYKQVSIAARLKNNDRLYNNINSTGTGIKADRTLSPYTYDRDRDRNNNNNNNNNIRELKTTHNNNRSTTPLTNNRVDRLSNMYDQIQVKKQQILNNRQPRQQQRQKQRDRQRYNLNRGHSYKFNNDQDQDQLNKRMGLVTANRRVQSPPRKSRSPIKDYTYKYKQETKYNPQTGGYQPYNTSYYLKTREVVGGDRSGGKNTYGYFDKNR